MTHAVKGFARFVRDCMIVRRLLAAHRSPNLESLCWYGRPLAWVVSPEGVAHVLRFQLGGARRDAIAANYGPGSLYFEEPEGDGLGAPRPTVWHCRALASRPFWDDDSPARRALEASAAAIREEYGEVLRRHVGLHPDNASLTRGGRWDGLFLYFVRGQRNDALLAAAPRTAAVVDALPLCKSFGFAMFSVLEPGTHVLPHSGSSNLRLRHHLGVEVPEPGAARMRVGTTWRAWEPDRCLVFDDSFEHEVKHEGAARRTVLSVDLWHPALTPAEVAVLSHPVFHRFGKL